MTSYKKKTQTINGEKIILSYQVEGKQIFIPHAADNMDFVRMMQEIDAGTSTIEEVEE